MSLALGLSCFLMGLAGSLHCLGMCGPLLLTFGSVRGEWMGWRGLLICHMGRVWTYALLGTLAGGLGGEMQRRAIVLGWQRPLALILGAALVLLGLLLATGRPLVRQSGPACPMGRLGRWTSVLRREAPMARFLLGVCMGFLPCGLVYGALLIAATTASPLAGAGAMVCFGLGTSPVLSGTVWLGRRLPISWRRFGPRWAAAMLLFTGLVVWVRGGQISSGPVCEAEHGSAHVLEAPARADSHPNESHSKERHPQ